MIETRLYNWNPAHYLRRLRRAIVVVMNPPPYQAPERTSLEKFTTRAWTFNLFDCVFRCSVLISPHIHARCNLASETPRSRMGSPSCALHHLVHPARTLKQTPSTSIGSPFCAVKQRLFFYISPAQGKEKQCFGTLRRDLILVMEPTTILGALLGSYINKARPAPAVLPRCSCLFLTFEFRRRTPDMGRHGLAEATRRTGFHGGCTGRQQCGQVPIAEVVV